MKQCLFTLDSLPAVSLAKVESQRRDLQQQAAQLRQQLSDVDPNSICDKAMDELKRGVAKLKKRFNTNDSRTREAEKQVEEKSRRRDLRQQLNEVNAELALVARKESRLLMLIEEKYVRPNMDRKVLVDAIRITCRNIFCQALTDFRPAYDNYRDDHVVLRALTHAAGIVIAHADRVDVHLLPRLDRQPEQSNRIEGFLRGRERKIEDRFGTKVRFLVGQSDKQLFYAISRALGYRNEPLE